MAVLTPQQLVIVSEAADGLTVREIAKKLWLSPHTVVRHMYLARKRAGARTTGQLVAIAHREGWIG